MKEIIFLILLFGFMGCFYFCSKSLRDGFFGENIPNGGITRSLPNIVLEKNTSNKSLSPDYQKHLDMLLDNKLVKVDSLQLFQNGDSYLPLLQMIEKTKKYFYINLLSFSCDESTEAIVQQLIAKARSGVDVRMIINKGFSYLSLSCLKRLKDAGVKLVKTKAHSSYFINDQQELMIGSQSVAKMFYLSDGFNSLDRDMMIYTKGPLALDALKDFLSSWIEENNSFTSTEFQSDVTRYQDLLKEEYLQKKRSDVPYAEAMIKPDKVCRFISERPSMGIKDIQTFWKEQVKINQKELFFSGVKVEVGDGSLGRIIKDKSKNGVSTHYLGNGYDSGNGELTMVLNEWILNFKKKSWPFLASLLEKINDWDKSRLARKNQEFYNRLKENASINVWAYFNFIHYKVWLFDHPGFFIGSANLDESKFGQVSDAGIFCFDSHLHHELKAQLLRDRLNSVLYIPKLKVSP